MIRITRNSRFITGVLIVASCLTFASAPARAGDGDKVAKVLGAAATLYIIGKLIEEHNEGRAKVQVHQTPRAVQPQRRAGVQVIRPGHQRARSGLPRQCLISAAQGSGTRYVMGQGCISKHYRGAQRLPNACRIQFRGSKGYFRDGYSVRCLRNRGFELARR